MNRKTATFVVFFILVVAASATIKQLNVSLGAESENQGEVINYAVKPDDTFGSIMEKFGLGDKAASIIDAASDIYNFKNIRVSNLFRFSVSENGIDTITYDIDNKEKVVIQNSLENIEVTRANILYDRKEITAGNIITSSLYKDAKSVGVPDKVILNLAEIFAWDIDFVTNIRKGDSFSVAYDDLYRDGFYVGPGRINAARFENDGSEFWAFYFDGEYYDLEGKKLARQFLKSPLSYSRISSGFSYNRLDPVTRSSYGAHRAIDYAAPPGTPVSATGDGQVVHAGWGTGLGLYVQVDHGGVYSTIYAHLSGLAKGIRRGAQVKQSDVVGFVGSTGYATGPHLHYEMRKYGNRINPLTLDLPPGEPLPKEKMPAFLQTVEKYRPLLQI